MAHAPIRSLAVALAAVFAAACSSTPRDPGQHASDRAAARAAGYAHEMVGTPYKFGGASPSGGFDCSGLVQFSYGKVGIDLPHNTRMLLNATRPISRKDLRRGDLIFFDQEGQKNSHVGIYLGDGKFVHAPSSGKRVRADPLDLPYWKKHYSTARRI